MAASSYARTPRSRFVTYRAVSQGPGIAGLGYPLPVLTLQRGGIHASQHEVVVNPALCADTASTGL